MTRELELEDRIKAELTDSFDEELELEIDDELLSELVGNQDGDSSRNALDRRIYFETLFDLQSELIKLQDWVAATKQKVVVIFEGRDAAGKGGVIKRITQRLNPRICRVVALDAPTERERSQWYFQRYIRTFPLAGKSSCSTAAGTTAPASSGSWAFAPKMKSRSSSARCRNSNECW